MIGSGYDVILADDHIGIHKNDISTHRGEMLYDVVENSVPAHADDRILHVKSIAGRI